MLQACARDLVTAAYRHWPEVVSVDDEASLMDGSLFLSTIEYSANHPLLFNSDGNKVLSSHKNTKCDYPEPSATSPDIMPSLYSLSSLTTLDDYVFPTIDSMDVRLDQSLTITGQVANNMICDTDSMAQAFYDDENLQFFDSDCTLPTSTLGSSADLHTAVHGIFPRTVPSDKAQARWAMLFSILKWFQVRRIVARRLC